MKSASTPFFCLLLFCDFFKSIFFSFQGVGGKGGINGLDHHMAYEGNSIGIGIGDLRLLGGDWKSKKGKYSPRYSKNAFGKILSCRLVADNSDPSGRTSVREGEHGGRGKFALQNLSRSKPKTPIDEAGIERQMSKLKESYGEDVLDLSSIDSLTKNLSQGREKLETAEKSKQGRDANAEKTSAVLTPMMTKSEKAQMEQMKAEKLESYASSKAKESTKQFQKQSKEVEASVAAKKKAMQNIEKIFKQRRERKVEREVETMRITGN